MVDVGNGETALVVSYQLTSTFTSTNDCCWTECLAGYAVINSTTLPPLQLGVAMGCMQKKLLSQAPIGKRQAGHGMHPCIPSIWKARPLQPGLPSEYQASHTI